MPHIVMYTTALCPFCTRARRLLSKKGVVWEELRVDEDSELRLEMHELAASREVPQIFVDGVLIGGYDKLVELDIEDALDPLLGIEDANTNP